MGGDNNAADFTGLFTIQKQYLADLSAISKTDTNATSYYQALSTKLNDLYNTYNSTNPASSVALDHQNKMMNIIETEKTRLEQKKVGIDNAYFTQKRLIELNESYREKNMKYITILIIIIITIVIYLALLMISKNLPFIPTGIINVLIALLFAISFIIVCVIIARINKRDPMNFQKLLFVPPKTQTGNVYSTVSGNVFMSDFNFNNCIGSSCCGNGTVWNSTYGNCVATSGFTLMNGFDGNNSCGSCGTVNLPYIPYTPSEFESYAKI
jgi:hypothetical protein